ncbi:MAG: bifunctional 2-polyprenyl-6-hydroxyphenol methylase/3-demethylubiquinol 3-O-methyltransferase UbiG [Proteobacteria bacterium]|nr:bifunctional 2-polyprenyl-6-hydroxyphenol methylase/3-demethylubiquinol 3-O-methyltransferase UbiG [Pseudomonadota bacterium]
MLSTPSNLDESELAKFEALAQRWWDRDGAFKALHDINPLRLDFIEDRAELAGKKVLDIGCGGGILAEGLARREAEVRAIDLGEASLAVAHAHADEQGLEIEYQAIAAEALAEQEPASFDVVTCLEMLEHVPDPSSIVEASAQLVKPGGDVFFSTINRNLRALLVMIVGGEYVMQMVPRGTHEYEKLIRPGELDRWIRRAGMYAQEIRGMSYNLLNKTYRLSDDLGTNYLVHACRSA